MEKLFNPLSCPSMASSFILVALGAAVSPAAYPFDHTALLSCYHCIMSCWSGSQPLDLEHYQY